MQQSFSMEWMWSSPAHHHVIKVASERVTIATRGGKLIDTTDHAHFTRSHIQWTLSTQTDESFTVSFIGPTTDRYTENQIGRQTERQKDRQTDRQTDLHIMAGANCGRDCSKFLYSVISHCDEDSDSKEKEPFHYYAVTAVSLPSLVVASTLQQAAITDSLLILAIAATERGMSSRSE